MLKEIGNRQHELRLAIAKAVAKEAPSITGLLVHADAKAIAAMETQMKAIGTGDEGSSDVEVDPFESE